MLYQQINIPSPPSSHPTPWQWRRCSRTPPPPRWSQTSFRARARGSIRCDTTLRFDPARPDVLTTAAAYFFDFMALQHHFSITSGNFNPAMLAAAHLTIALGSNAHFRLLSPLDSRPRARFVPATPRTRACTHLCTGSFLMSLIPASACMCLARAYPLFPVAVGHAHSMRTQRICRRYRPLACWFPALAYTCAPCALALAHADQAHAQHTHTTAYAHSDTANHPSKPRARTMRSGDAS